MKKLKQLENSVTSPISLQEFDINSINESLRAHEVQYSYPRYYAFSN